MKPTGNHPAKMGLERLRQAQANPDQIAELGQIELGHDQHNLLLGIELWSVADPGPAQVSEERPTMRYVRFQPVLMKPATARWLADQLYRAADFLEGKGASH